VAEKMAIDLLKYEKDLTKLGNADTAVIVVSGVNGVGKTTTIGKIGKFFKDNNKSVVFGAADTFRAAAIDQLQLWATKVRVDIIKSKAGSDPASVAFKTAEFAKKNKIDIALIDTAGRLQNKKNLMEEYKKIINVLKKVDSTFPNETIMVLDATTGQNAIGQVEEFSKIHNLTGLIITKLDTTAKGGVVLAICKKYNLPIVAIGLGEKDNDLHPFRAEFFAKALLGLES
jgi:fused signal recognition particle receptor